MFKKSRSASIVLFFSVFILMATDHGTDNKGKKPTLKQFIFDAQKIEGKIRRPQLVLIKAEQRPHFEPMVLQGLGKTGDITGSVDKTIIDESPYDDAFEFRGKKSLIIYPDY